MLALVIDDIDIHHTYDHPCTIRCHGASPRTSHATVTSSPAGFFISAKPGAGVSDLYAYVAQRVVTRWEWAGEETRAEPPNGVTHSSTVNPDQTMADKRHLEIVAVLREGCPKNIEEDV
jgi:hypothetical protein